MVRNAFSSLVGVFPWLRYNAHWKLLACFLNCINRLYKALVWNWVRSINIYSRDKENVEDFISLNVYSPKTWGPELKSRQKAGGAQGSPAGVPAGLCVSAFAFRVSGCEFVHFPVHAALLWAGFITLWVFLEGWNVLLQSGWQHRALGRLAETWPALSVLFPSSATQFSLVLSLSVAHRCFGGSLHDVVFSDRVSPRILKGSARGTMSCQLRGNFYPSALSLYCASLKNYLIFTVLFYMCSYKLIFSLFKGKLILIVRMILNGNSVFCTLKFLGGITLCNLELVRIRFFIKVRSKWFLINNLDS